ncbi:Inorganic phosphate cotransporter [Gryllus bimaculatus]|nr:Inorganic phosphate cotransporter [Gryllus bimaculatus]
MCGPSERGDEDILLGPEGPCRVPARFVFAALASACFAISYGANVVLSVAIVAMVNHTAIDRPHRADPGLWPTGANATTHCPEPPGHHHDQDGPFAWDDVVQGYVRGAYYYGYLLAQLPGALLAERRGAKWVLWAANALNVAGLLLTPLAARAGYGVFAVTFPAMHVMMSNWAPPEERGVIGGIVYAGTSLGTIGATLVGGYVSAAAGWPWVFYALGLASLPWCALWAWLVDDHPATATHICQQERLRLCDQLGQPRDAAALELPVRAVCSSGAFWALLATHFCSNCGWYMFLTELPGFMQEVLHKNIKENAGISAVPYVLMWLLRRLMAITNTIATIPGILMPILIGVLTEGQETLARWSIAFYITAALYALMFIVFTFCGSGEEQPWNNPDEVMGGLLDPEYNPANFIDSLDPYFTHERTQVTA